MTPALLLTLVSQSLQPAGSVYKPRPLVSALTFGSVAAVAVLIDREKKFHGGTSPCVGPCLREDVWESERWVTYHDDRSARLASDILLGVLGLSPYAVDFVDVLAADVNGAGLRWGEDTLVALQTQAITLLVTNVLKLAVRRPRPFAYNPDVPQEERFEGDARMSFPSGHSSFAFASASILVRTAELRHGDSPFTWILGSTAYLTAIAVAYLRVAGGKHFVTDVLAGAVLGTVIGLLVPMAFRRSGGDEEPPVASRDAALFGFTTTF